MKQLISILAFLVIYCFEIQAQDTQFSQFYAAPTLLNPSFAGTSEYGRVVLNYRNQWPELNKAFITYNAAVDVKIDQLHGGLGMSIMSDAIGGGQIVSNQINLMYSYLVPITRELTLALGVEASLYQNTLNWNKLIFPDMIDQVKGAVLPTGQQIPDYSMKKTFADFTAGATIYNKDFYLGFAAHHLTAPSTSLYNGATTQLQRAFLLQAGYQIIAGTEHGKVNLAYYPGIIIQKQGALNQVNYGFYVKNDFIVGGLWYRQNFKFQSDALIFLVGVYFKKLKISYSYDLPVSPLFGYSYASHEVTLGFSFSKGATRIRMEAIPCPDF